jgi:hypothetical protein
VVSAGEIERDIELELNVSTVHMQESSFREHDDGRRSSDEREE